MSPGFFTFYSTKIKSLAFISHNDYLYKTNLYDVLFMLHQHQKTILMITLEKALNGLTKNNSQFVVVLNPTTKEKVYVDGKKLEDNTLIKHIKMGSYSILPSVIYYMDFTDWQDFEATISTAKSLLGYVHENIHVVIDHSVDYNYSPHSEIIENKVVIFNISVKMLLDMGDRRFKDYFGGELVII